jgi:hypothetical protein
MVLVNVARGATAIAADFHSVPTIHPPAANEAPIKGCVRTANAPGRLAAAVIVPEAASGNLTVSAPSSVTEGNSYPVTASWQGLTPGLKYLGTLTHHRRRPGAGRFTTHRGTSVFIDVP